jgi:HSP20 family molecular chaperone IbpA
MEAVGFRLAMLGRWSLWKGSSEMTRMSLLNSPLLLGFDDIERVLDRVTKLPGDGYPPYNIEKIARPDGGAEIIRITLAVAGFSRDQLDVAVEDNQMTIRGKQDDDKSRTYLHRGIAARQFQRNFLLADGMLVKDAILRNGMLLIAVVRPKAEKIARRVEVRSA